MINEINDPTRVSTSYRRKSNVYAVMRRDQYAEGVSSRIVGETFLFMRSRYLRDRYVYTERAYRKITSFSRKRLYNVMLAYACGEINPPVNKSVSFHLNFEHRWIKGLG